VGERTKKCWNIVVDAFLTTQSVFIRAYVSCSRLTKCILIHYSCVSEILTRNNSISQNSFRGCILHRTERNGVEGAKYSRNSLAS
jgi:hypothetical protein